MARGGINKGTLSPTWNAGKTTTVRVPIAKKEEILKVARALDLLNGKGIVLDSDSLEKAINLLESCEKMKANSGGAIKAKIREALGFLKA